MSNGLAVSPRLDEFTEHADHEPDIGANDADAHDIKVARVWTVLGCICKLTTSVGSASIAAENFSRCHCHCFLMSLISRTSQCVVYLSWREGVPHITLGIDADPARFAVLRSAAVGWQRVRIEVVAPRRSEDTSGFDETHGIAPQ